MWVAEALKGGGVGANSEGGAALLRKRLLVPKAPGMLPPAAAPKKLAGAAADVPAPADAWEKGPGAAAVEKV